MPGLHARLHPRGRVGDGEAWVVRSKRRLLPEFERMAARNRRKLSLGTALGNKMSRPEPLRPPLLVDQYFVSFHLHRLKSPPLTLGIAVVSNLVCPRVPPDHQHPCLSLWGVGRLGVPLPVLPSQQRGHLSVEPADAAAWTCL